MLIVYTAHKKTAHAKCMNCFYLVNRKHINTSYSYIRKKYFFLTASHCGKAFFYYLQRSHLLSLICGFSRKKIFERTVGKNASEVYLFSAA